MLDKSRGDSMLSPPLWTRAFIILTLSHLLGASGYASMILLPRYLDHLGGSRADIGFIMAIANLVGLLTRPIVGWALDAAGRKRALVFGGFVTALSLAGVYLIEDVGPMAYSVRALFGFGEGFLFTGYFALASDIIPKERRTEGLALFGVAGLLPLLVNPLADLLKVSGAGLRDFIPLVSLFILGSALLIFLIPDRDEATSQDGQSSDKQSDKQNNTVGGVERSHWHDTLNKLNTPALRTLWGATAAFAGGVSLMMTFASVIAESRGLALPSAVWFTYVLGAVSVRLFGARLPERIGAERLVAPTLALYGAALIVCVTAQGELGVLSAGLLAGLSHGYCFPVLTSLIVGRVDATYRGRALAMFTGLWGAAGVCFATLGGALADRWGDVPTFCFFGALMLLASLRARPARMIG